MLYWAIGFLALAVAAAGVAFAGVAAGVVGAAKGLFVTCLVLSGVALLVGRTRVVG
jgi:uncharacterized membrane protein YtjA (UPF0391 family)